MWATRLGYRIIQFGSTDRAAGRRRRLQAALAPGGATTCSSSAKRTRICADSSSGSASRRRSCPTSAMPGTPAARTSRSSAAIPGRRSRSASRRFRSCRSTSCGSLPPARLAVTSGCSRPALVLAIGGSPPPARWPRRCGRVLWATIVGRSPWSGVYVIRIYKDVRRRPPFIVAVRDRLRRIATPRRADDHPRGAHRVVMTPPAVDLVLVNPGSRARIYQSLGATLTAVENPVWAGLIATFVRRQRLLGGDRRRGSRRPLAGGGGGARRGSATRALPRSWSTATSRRRRRRT